MSNTAERWAELTRRYHDLQQLSYLHGLVGWDQQTYMPPGSGESRGEHMAFIAGLAHTHLVDDGFADCLASLRDRASELDEVQRAGVRNLWREHQRARAIPEALVKRLSRLQARGFAAWMSARQAGDFGVLAPVLTEIVAAVGERAQAMAGGGEPYAAMVDEYDPGVTPQTLGAMFERLRAGLAPLVDGIRGAEAMPPLPGPFSEDRQLGLARHVAGCLGLDPHQGRVDLATHPFSVTIGATDVRITTRLNADDLLDMLGSTIHETGHALYEQGLPRTAPGVSEPASTGVHESQSRFWENMIGRSRPFLAWLRGPMAEAYGSAPDLDTLYRAANRVAPGFIRVAADEVTYNLHVGLRFDLERQLFAPTSPLPVAELPDAWNAAMARDLGLEVEDPTKGVLQDVHWASGAFGYFPSYTLGNLYAASLMRTLQSEVPSVWDHVEDGDFAPIVSWLQTHVHAHGSTHLPADLITHVCGERDLVQDLLDHLWGRHGTLYGLRRIAA